LDFASTEEDAVAGKGRRHKAKAKARGAKRARTKRTKPPLKGRRDWRTRFLAALRRDPSVSHAAKLAGVGRQYAYQVRDGSDKFAAEWWHAREEYIDSLESEAGRRAKRKSNTLLIFMLKSLRRGTYGERIRHEVQPLLLWDLPTPEEARPPTASSSPSS